MYPFVLRTQHILGEALPAVLARKPRGDARSPNTPSLGPNHRSSSMGQSSFVRSQLVASSERLLANSALVRLLTRVDQHVPVQVLPRFKPRVASGANKGSRQMHALMLFEKPRRVEDFVTPRKRTRKRHLRMSLQNMRVQRRCVLVHLVAQRARKYGFLMESFDVHSETSHETEYFVTLRTRVLLYSRRYFRFPKHLGRKRWDIVRSSSRSRSSRRRQRNGACCR